MLRLMCATATAMLLALPAANAQVTDTRFGGEVMIRVVSSACLAAGAGKVVVGAFYHSVFRPRGTATNNGPDSHLNFIALDRSMILTVLNGDLGGTGPYAGTAVRTFGGSMWSGQRSAFSTLPAVVTETTTEVVIKGRITKFFNISGCTVTFTGTFTKQL